MGRILAIDYGTKRLGIALSDETKNLAFARPHILTEEKHKLLDLIKEKQIEQIILGLPLNLAGRETRSAQAARKFGSWLGEKTRLAVVYIDERFSTREILRSFPGVKTREIVDSLVAQKMLERYLK